MVLKCHVISTPLIASINQVPSIKWKFFLLLLMPAFPGYGHPFQRFIVPIASLIILQLSSKKSGPRNTKEGAKSYCSLMKTWQMHWFWKNMDHMIHHRGTCHIGGHKWVSNLILMQVQRPKKLGWNHPKRHHSVWRYTKSLTLLTPEFTYSIGIR